MSHNLTQNCVFTRFAAKLCLYTVCSTTVSLHGAAAAVVAAASAIAAATVASVAASSASVAC